MSSGSAHDAYERLILAEVEAGHGVSQRALAKRMGVALGLTNLLLRRLISKGWVRISHVKPNRVIYLLTPAGIAEKAKMTRAYFAASTRFYAETRDRIRERFGVLSAEWPVDGNGPAVKNIVFYGAGEVAEIGYVCLQETDLCLVAVFDDDCAKPFFGIPVRPAAALSVNATDQPIGRIVVMSFGDVENIREKLQATGVPPRVVFWI